MKTREEAAQDFISEHFGGDWVSAVIWLTKWQVERKPAAPENENRRSQPISRIDIHKEIGEEQPRNHALEEEMWVQDEAAKDLAYEDIEKIKKKERENNPLFGVCHAEIYLEPALCTNPEHWSPVREDDEETKEVQDFEYDACPTCGLTLFDDGDYYVCQSGHLFTQEHLESIARKIEENGRSESHPYSIYGPGQGPEKIGSENLGEQSEHKFLEEDRLPGENTMDYATRKLREDGYKANCDEHGDQIFPWIEETSHHHCPYVDEGCPAVVCDWRTCFKHQEGMTSSFWHCTTWKNENWGRNSLGPHTQDALDQMRKEDEEEERRRHREEKEDRTTQSTDSLPENKISGEGYYIEVMVQRTYVVKKHDEGEEEGEEIFRTTDSEKAAQFLREASQFLREYPHKREEKENQL